jgi:hypothetical protein
MKKPEIGDIGRVSTSPPPQVNPLTEPDQLARAICHQLGVRSDIVQAALARLRGPLDRLMGCVGWSADEEAEVLLGEPLPLRQWRAIGLVASSAVVVLSPMACEAIVRGPVLYRSIAWCHFGAVTVALLRRRYSGLGMISLGDAQVRRLQISLIDGASSRQVNAGSAP